MNARPERVPASSISSASLASAANSASTPSKRRWKNSAVSRKIVSDGQAAGPFERGGSRMPPTAATSGAADPAMKRRQAAGSTGSIGSSST